MPTALITGVTGQDGSYLAELLLEKGYEVYGVVRRVAIDDDKRFWRINNIKDKINIVGATMENYASLIKIIAETNPDEVYHLAAQSFVAHSFEDEFSTMQININGTHYLLSAIERLCLKTKFYFAATSEMFGNSPAPQDEGTPFMPRSIYGISKLTSFQLTKNYREAYGIFGCSGILFNHESILKNSPIILKNVVGEVDILPIEDLFRTENHKYEGILDKYKTCEVWDGDNWTRIIKGSCYKDMKKEINLIQTVSSCCETTLEHSFFDNNGDEIENKALKISDTLYNAFYPSDEGFLNPDLNLCKFLGFVVGDGYIPEDGCSIRLTGIDKQQLIEYANLLCGIFGFTYKCSTWGPGQFDGCTKDIWQLEINVNSYFGKWLRGEIYTLRSSEKKVPKFILNGSTESKKQFFDGYYDADGRKSGNERYLYKGFTTKSATLCLGLLYIMKSFSIQEPKCKCEYRNGKRYYRVQFRCDYETSRGNSVMKNLNEIISIYPTESEDGWFYDIQTESQSFATGPNLIKIHNSPRRGLEFVTRKITDGVARIMYGLQDHIELGNLDAKRDWGYAKDYVEGMWLMLQQDEPDDYVLATGETHSIREFCEEAFGYLDMDYNDYVVVNPKFYRPAEVHQLCGNASKAQSMLGWEHTVGFKELVIRMVESDLKRYKEETI